VQTAQILSNMRQASAFARRTGFERTVAAADIGAAGVDNATGLFGRIRAAADVRAAKIWQAKACSTLQAIRR
jgi:hypothetical protein